MTSQRGLSKVGTIKAGPSPILSRITDLLFVCVAAYLFIGYALLLLRPISALVLVRETFSTVYLLMALAFLAFRKNMRTYTTRRVDYIYTILGFGAPLLFQLSSYAGAIFVGILLEAIGTVLVAGALLSLNRSFGLAPENRGIKTAGAYRLVRHPMYLGYILAEVGYVVTYFSDFNLFVLAISVLFLMLRLRAEEQLLAQDQVYRNYSKKTRWKLIPFLF